MTFLSENYIWIIVVAIILLMAIIGYVADKHGFGKQNKKEKKGKKVEDNKEIVADKIDNDESNTDNIAAFAPAPEEASLSDFQEPDENMPNVDVSENLNTFESENGESTVFENMEPTEETYDKNEELPQDNEVEIPQAEEMPVDTELESPQLEAAEVNNEIDNSQLDTTSEMENSELEPPEMPVDTESTETAEMAEPSEESINLEEQSLEPASLDSITETENEKQENFDLPNIDELNQEISSVDNNDEDVWKF